MTDERRYDEDEVRRIFDVAAEAESRDVARRPGGGGDVGFTLRDLQEIGAEAGIAPDMISQAAADLDAARGGAVAEHRRGAQLQRVLGLPLAVGRDVALPRDLTEAEWGSLVAEMRRTFSARGRLDAMGPVREWRNGNLYVTLEPTADGAHLTMGTRKGNAAPMAAASAGLLALSILLFVVLTLTGQLAEGTRVIGPIVLGAMGLAFGGANVLGLPAWARTRAEQLEAIGARASMLASGDPPPSRGSGEG